MGRNTLKRDRSGPSKKKKKTNILRRVIRWIACGAHFSRRRGSSLDIDEMPTDEPHQEVQSYERPYQESCLDNEMNLQHRKFSNEDAVEEGNRSVKVDLMIHEKPRNKQDCVKENFVKNKHTVKSIASDKNKLKQQDCHESDEKQSKESPHTIHTTEDDRLVKQQKNVKQHQDTETEEDTRTSTTECLPFSRDSEVQQISEQRQYQRDETLSGKPANVSKHVPQLCENVDTLITDPTSVLGCHTSPPAINEALRFPATLAGKHKQDGNDERRTEEIGENEDSGKDNDVDILKDFETDPRDQEQDENDHNMFNKNLDIAMNEDKSMTLDNMIGHSASIAQKRINHRKVSQGHQNIFSPSGTKTRDNDVDEQKETTNSYMADNERAREYFLQPLPTQIGESPFPALNEEIPEQANDGIEMREGSPVNERVSTKQLLNSQEGDDFHQQPFDQEEEDDETLFSEEHCTPEKEGACFVRNNRLRNSSITVQQGDTYNASYNSSKHFHYSSPPSESESSHRDGKKSSSHPSGTEERNTEVAVFEQPNDHSAFSLWSWLTTALSWFVSTLSWLLPQRSTEVPN